MKDELKQPLSVRFMDFWNSLPPSIRYSIPFIIAGLLTALQQVLDGMDWKQALSTFITVLIGQIVPLKAISSVASEKEKVAEQSEPVFGINPNSEVPDSSQVDPITS